MKVRIRASDPSSRQSPLRVITIRFGACVQVRRQSLKICRVSTVKLSAGMMHVIKCQGTVRKGMPDHLLHPGEIVVRYPKSMHRQGTVRQR